MVYIYFKASFGAFRSFKSVEMSPTAEFITHSAAYGLLLGVAGIDRQDKQKFVGAKIAIGMKRLPKVGRTYQQLIQGRRELDGKKGGHFNLRPFWREVLVGLEGYIGLDHSELESLVRLGINQPSELRYWGLPFLGDNNFLVERIDAFDRPSACQWLCPLTGDETPNGGRLFYLTVWTDYQDSTGSKSLLFYLENADDAAPQKAWIPIQP